eukprot:6078923-Pleurochrysis_carterae.AAC.1
MGDDFTATSTVDSPTRESSIAPCAPAPSTAPVAPRITKTSDPDHPFHPCDDIDSDDPMIEALLDSSSSNSRDA